MTLTRVSGFGGQDGYSDSTQAYLNLINPDYGNIGGLYQNGTMGVEAVLVEVVCVDVESGEYFFKYTFKDTSQGDERRFTVGSTSVPLRSLGWNRKNL